MSKNHRKNRAFLAASIGAFSTSNGRQRRVGFRTLFASAVATIGVGSCLGTGGVQAANTAVFVLDATDLSAAATYGGSLPTATNDVELQPLSYSNPTLFSTNGAALTFGTLDDLNTTQSLVISDTSAGSITLNTAVNSISPTAGDLLLVNSGANLTFQGGTGTTTLIVGVSGNIDNAGTLTLANPINSNAATTISFTGAGATTVSGSIAATTGAVTINDAGGSVTFSGTNLYTGNTTINAGTLNLGGGTATGSISSSSILVLGGGTLSYTATGGATQTFANTAINIGVSGLGAVAGDTLALNTITRAVGGTVDFGNTGTVTATNGNTNGILGGYATFGNTTWAVGGGTITGLASYTLTTVAGTAAGNYTNNNIDVNSSLTLGGTITPNSLRFNTAGADTLTLATGTSIIGTGGILETATVANHASTITGGTLEGASGADLVVIQNNTSNTLTIKSVIANNGSATGLTKSGAGRLILTGNNTFTGPLTINNGEVQLGNGSLNPAVNVTVANGAALEFNTTTATFTMGNMTNGLTVSGSGLSNAGAISNIAGDTIVGGPIGNGTGTYLGRSYTRLMPGTTVYPAGNTTIGSAAGYLVLNTNITPTATAGNTTLTLRGASATMGGGSSHDISINGLTDSNAINGTISNNGSSVLAISKQNSGIWVLSDITNSYSGGTTLSAGTLYAVNGFQNLTGNTTNAGNLDPLGTGSVTLAGGTLFFAGADNTWGPGIGYTVLLTANSSMSANNDSAFTTDHLSNGIQQIGNLTLGNNTLTFSETNRMAMHVAGNTTLSGANDGFAIAAWDTFTNTPNFATLTLDGDISGIGTLNNLAVGTGGNATNRAGVLGYDSASNADFSGGTNLAGGTAIIWRPGAARATPSASPFQFGTGTITLTGNGNAGLNTSFALQGSTAVGTPTVNTTPNYYINNAFDIKAGNSTINVGGTAVGCTTPSYAYIVQYTGDFKLEGNLTFDAGSLNLQAGTAPATSLGATNPGFFSGNLTVTGGNQTVYTAQSSVTTPSQRNVTWSGNITEDQPGRLLTIGAAGNTTFLMAGTVTPDIAVATGTAGSAATVASVFTPGTFNGNVTVASGATLLGGGNFTSALSLNGNAIMDLNGTTTTTVAQLTGAGNVASSSTALNSTLTISGGNSTFGGLIKDTAGTGNKTVALIVNNPRNTFTLSGANTYSGGTTVNGGTLAVANTSGSATGIGTVTVNNGGILGGNGTIAPTGTSGTLMAIASGGQLSPSAGAGNTTTTLNANVSASASPAALDIAGGTIFNFNFAGPGNSDTLSITGNVTLELGTDVLNITQLPSFAVGNYTLISAGNLTDNVGNWTLPSGGNYTYAITNTSTALMLDVTPSGPVTLIWNGNNTASWDTTSYNWQGSAHYADGDLVVFADILLGNFTVDLGGVTFYPGAVTVNNSNSAYSIGNGSIGGNATLTKNGTNILTLTGNNTYSGGTTVNAGTLDVATASSGLLSGSSVTNYANLQFDGAQTLSAITGNGTTTVNGSLTVGSISQTSLVNNGAMTVNGIGTVATLSDTSGLGSAGNTTVGSAGSLTVTGFAQTNLINNGTTNINGNGTIGQLSGNGSLTIGNGSLANTVTLATVATPGVLGGIKPTQGLVTIASGSTLDIANNALLLNYGGNGTSPLAAVANAVAYGAGKAGNASSNGAIISSTVNNSLAVGKYAVGYADHTEISTVPTGNVEVAYTLAGDANLDGSADILDYQQMAPHYDEAGVYDWSQGDFNHDGHVDILDYQAMAPNYDTKLTAGTLIGADSLTASMSLTPADIAKPIGGAVAAAELQASDPSVTSEASPTDITAAVPEPASLSLLLLGGIPLLGRRRRRARNSAQGSV